MSFAASGCIHFFRIPSEKPGENGETTIAEEEAADQSPEEERYILCRQCHQAITRETERIAMQGSHRHTFANPHGIVFEIGCFKNVIGCGYVGEATDEFSWFAGLLLHHVPDPFGLDFQFKMGRYVSWIDIGPADRTWMILQGDVRH
jgi:hypothetical protein